MTWCRTRAERRRQPKTNWRGALLLTPLYTRWWFKLIISESSSFTCIGKVTFKNIRPVISPSSFKTLDNSIRQSPPCLYPNLAPSHPKLWQLQSRGRESSLLFLRSRKRIQVLSVSASAHMRHCTLKANARLGRVSEISRELSLCFFLSKKAEYVSLSPSSAPEK